MNEPSGWNIGRCLLGVAFTALLLAALVVRPDREGIVGVAAVGHLTWAATLFQSRVRGSRCIVTMRSLGALGLVEALGACAFDPGPQRDLACWLLIGASFAIAGAVTAARGEPGDMAFTGQLAFHGMILLPSATIVEPWLAAWAHAPFRSLAWESSWSVRAAAQIVSILSPGMLALLAFALAVQLNNPGPVRRDVWSALLAHETLILLLLWRWTRVSG